MKRVNGGRAMLGGFLGTLAMTLLLYMAAGLGLTEMDIAAMLGTLLSDGVPPPVYSALWWTGMAWHFFNGTVVFALIYAWVLYPFLPGEPWVRGLLWGVVLFLFFDAAFLPYLGFGYFGLETGNAMMAILGPLMLHFVYGAILGAVGGAAVPASTRFGSGRTRPLTS